MKYLIAIALVFALLTFVQAQNDSSESDVEVLSTDTAEPSSDTEAPTSEEPKPPKPEGPKRPPLPDRHHIGHHHSQPPRHPHREADNEVAEGRPPRGPHRRGPLVRP